MNKIIKLYQTCKNSETLFLTALIKYVVYKLIYKIDVITHHKVIIKAIKKISTNSRLFIGTRRNDLLLKDDRTLLNVNGKLNIKGDYSIGRGCRIAIGKNAEVFLEEGYININSMLIINHGLSIGKDSFISWNCQILDDDFHEIIYDDKKDTDNKIKIGNHVWIGSNVSILKCVEIADNCIVAANSVVTKKFTEKNCLIAGSPAKIIKQNVNWK